MVGDAHPHNTTRTTDVFRARKRNDRSPLQRVEHTILRLEPAPPHTPTASSRSASPLRGRRSADEDDLAGRVADRGVRALRAVTTPACGSTDDDAADLDVDRDTLDRMAAREPINLLVRRST